MWEGRGENPIYSKREEGLGNVVNIVIVYRSGLFKF
jgi:hypothetical protein